MILPDGFEPSAEGTLYLLSKFLNYYYSTILDSLTIFIHPYFEQDYYVTSLQKYREKQPGKAEIWKFILKKQYALIVISFLFKKGMDNIK